MSPRRRARPARAGVLEPVVVALVAVDVAVDRVELEDRLPEAVGELVDGRGRIGHGSLRWARGGLAGWSGRAGRRGRSDRAGSTGPRASPAPGSALEQRHLLAATARRPDRARGTARGRRGRARRARGTSAGGPHLRMCQLPSSIASRSSGERSSLWRTSSVRSGAMTRKRTIALVGAGSGRGGAAAARRASRSTRPRTGTRALPRMYQMQSTSASSSAARLMPAEVGLALAVVEAVAQAPAAPIRRRLLAPADPDPHPEPVAAVGEQRRAARCAPGCGAAGRRR